ncbi:hypothetical protein AX16_006422 [Volvariella volvacea WC 439]|nr:hypothetical protein AX16_006422 [Volvariella volvacea WC 439]
MSIPASSMPASALDDILESGVIISSDTPEYNRISPLFRATDATSNPSLVLAAVSKPEYTHLVDNAIRFVESSGAVGSGDVEAKTQLALDYLLVQVGVEILKRVPGRVSVSVDPRLAYEYDAIIAKAKSLIRIFQTEFQIPSFRVLIKIPATYPGILAAQTLESSTNPTPIHTNMTLVFGTVQAIACAQAGVSVISPFIGRVKDWWVKHEAELKSQPSSRPNVPTPPPFVTDGFISDLPLSLHPGITMVRDIRRLYQRLGYDKTQVMAAGFRIVDEIVEICKDGPENGPDLVTLPPDLLEGLIERESRKPLEKDEDGVVVEREDSEGDQREEPRYVSPSPTATRLLVKDPTEPDEFLRVRDNGETPSDNDPFSGAYFEALRRERVAFDKVPEGLLKFSADARVLESQVRSKIIERMQVKVEATTGISEDKSGTKPHTEYSGWPWTSNSQSAIQWWWILGVGVATLTISLSWLDRASFGRQLRV